MSADKPARKKGDNVEIYGLFDPESGELRYVGKAVDSQKRLRAHLCEVRRRTPLYSWIENLRKRRLLPTLKVLSVIPEREWAHEERRIIFESRLTAHRLLNLADGGDQPLCSIETRRKNGFVLNARLKADPIARKIKMAKQMLGIGIRQGHVANRTRQKMRMAAAMNPRLFGAWAKIQDREE